VEKIWLLVDFGECVHSSVKKVVPNRMPSPGHKP
jgi:hypothetical protein